MKMWPLAASRSTQPPIPISLKESVALDSSDLPSGCCDCYN